MDLEINWELVLVALIGPAVTALATAVVVWLRDVIARRDEAFRRRRALETATQEVQFLQAWMAASRELDTDNTRNWVNGRVREDLAAAYALVVRARVGQETMLDRVRPNLRDMAKSIFLVRRLDSPWAFAARIVYYVLLFVLLLFSSYAVAGIVTGDLALAGGSAFLMIPVVVLMWMLRRLLFWLEGHRRRSEDTSMPGAAQAPGTRAEVSMQVLSDGVWQSGSLVDWRPYGDTWEGLVRLLDGTVPEWIPAERLRYAAGAEPANRA
jgi:hypothetical protein